MVKSLSICFLLLGVLSACAAIGRVPEISSDISEQRVFRIGTAKKPSRIIGSGKAVYFVSPQKQLVRYDPLTGRSGIELKVKRPLEQPVLFQNDTLVLKTAGGRRHIVYDLKEKFVSNFTMDRSGDPLGVDRQGILIRHDRHMILYDLPSMKPEKKIKLGRETALSCEFTSGKIIILTSEKLHLLERRNYRLKTRTLKKPAASGFLLWNDHLYYGSRDRELVKLSLKSNRIKWKRKLAMVLKQKPALLKRYLVVTPEDNNILFFNRNGTLRWWEKLDATRLHPPVIMKDNVAVFLMNDKIRFFYPEKKKVQTYTLKSEMDSNAVHINNFLYFFAHQENKKDRFIVRIGNRYTVRIKTEPAFLKPLGKSIKFDLTPVNLIKPRLNVAILNQSKQRVFETALTSDQLMSFVWVPEQAGTYRLELNVRAENRDVMAIRKNIKIIDMDERIRALTHRILKECRSDAWNHPPQNHE